MAAIVSRDVREQPPSHRPLEHTADVGIEVEAPSREALFAEAAVALCDTVTESRTVRPALERELAVEAADDELLLVDFLNEVVFLFETEGLVFGECAVELRAGAAGGEAERAGDTVALRAVLRGERYDRERHPLRAVVKAVTYHGLRVWRDGERWRALVLFDL
jgi:SHS2 domain-containing protein